MEELKYELFIKNGCDFFEKKNIATDLLQKGYKIIGQPEITNMEDGKLYTFKCEKI